MIKKSPFYKNIRLQQNEYFYKNISKIFDIIKPKRIIEIGTSFGGTTLLMSDTLKELGLNDTLIKSFDIRKSKHFDEIQNDNIEYCLEQIFDYKNNSLVKPEEIVDFLSDEGVNLIFCDGGNKISEFNILAKYLKKGDIIMAHDYAPNREVFDSEYKDKIWNWLEIEDKYIKKSVEEYNLFDYEMDLIKPTAWVAKIKK
jgi:predicted O-methyltransferase YrrM